MRTKLTLVMLTKCPITHLLMVPSEHASEHVMHPLTVAMCKEVEVLVGLFAVVTVRGSTGRLGVIATATPIAVKLTHINGVSPTSKSLHVAK